jgi:hypothetical protein
MPVATVAPDDYDPVQDFAQKSWHGERDPVFVWEIPDSRDNGYFLRIVAREGDDAEAARTWVLQNYYVQQPDGTNRSMSTSERNWITGQPPEAIVDTSTVTLGHAEALDECRRLDALNVAFRAAKETLDAHGIDIHDPQAWIDRQVSATTAKIASADRDRDLRHQRMSNALTDALDIITQAQEETGFAPPKPVLPPEPDYSMLTVILPPFVSEDSYADKIKGANFIKRAPQDISEAALAGMKILTKHEGLIEMTWRMGRVSDQERDELIEAQKAIKALTGV